MTAAYVKGATVQEVADRFGVHHVTVRRALKRANIKDRVEKAEQSVISEVVKSKAEQIEAAVDDLLSLIATSVIKFSTEEERARITIPDARSLTSMLKELNEIARLEKGLATQIHAQVSYSHDTIKVLIDDLRKLDPVMTYDNGSGQEVKELT